MCNRHHVAGPAAHGQQGNHEDEQKAAHGEVDSLNLGKVPGMTDLFNLTPPAAPLRIVPQQDQLNLSKGQKLFNTLVKKIEASRHDLAQWQATMDAFQQKLASDYVPLVDKFKGLQIDMAQALDQALDRHKLTKPERRFVADVICDVAEPLVIESGDPVMKALYNKHSEVDFDAQAAAAAKSMQAAMSDMFGVKIDEAADISSPQDLLDQVKLQLEKEQLLDMEREDEAQQRRSQRKKTVKQQAREDKEKTDLEQTSQSIREVYRKLVSALHPDRESDPAERARKTALMQRVNQAYDKKDLLLLLELQLELEHIDAATIAGLSEERLKHFNKILKDQLAELEQEIAYLEEPMRQMFRLPPHLMLKPQGVIPRLLTDIAELQRHIRQIKKDIEIPSDLAVFKAWIKARQREARALARQMDDDDEFPFF